jgi:hypothetical protein
MLLTIRYLTFINLSLQYVLCLYPFLCHTRKNFVKFEVLSSQAAVIQTSIQHSYGYPVYHYSALVSHCISNPVTATAVAAGVLLSTALCAERGANQGLKRSNVPQSPGVIFRCLGPAARQVRYGSTVQRRNVARCSTVVSTEVQCGTVRYCSAVCRVLSARSYLFLLYFLYSPYFICSNL